MHMLVHTRGQVYRILMRVTTAVQPLSCDEAYLDVTGIGDPDQIARDLRAEIARATGCPASCGIGPNPLLARMVRARPPRHLSHQAQRAPRA